MRTYRMTFMTMCGKTDVVVEDGTCYAEAFQKAQIHIINKHTKMKLINAEYKEGDRWYHV